MNIDRYIQQFRIKYANKLITSDGYKRLSLLADFLENLPEERFNLKNWASSNFKPNECGTTACACGWATTIFDDLELVNHLIRYKGYDSWFAVSDFFELSITEAEELFNPDHYYEKATPKMVATKIREFLA